MDLSNYGIYEKFDWLISEHGEIEALDLVFAGLHQSHEFVRAVLNCYQSNQDRYVSEHGGVSGWLLERLPSGEVLDTLTVLGADVESVVDSMVSLIDFDECVG